MKYYFIKKDNQEFGPISIEHLIEQGVTKNTLIWFEGSKDWIEAGLVEELEPLFNQNPASNDTITKNEDDEFFFNGWEVAFWIVSFLAVIDYLFRVIPKFVNADATGFFMYFGGFLPNLFVILLFWFIKKATYNKKKKKEA